MNIRKGDNILIIAGKDKGKKGKVEKVFPEKNKLVVTGANKAKKQIKPSRNNPQGGIIEISAPISRSKVMIICPHCDRPTRISNIKTEMSKERACRHCKESLEISNV